MPFTVKIESWEPEPGSDVRCGPVLPAGSVAIGNEVFRGADGINTFAIPDDITAIGMRAFS